MTEPNQENASSWAKRHDVITTLKSTGSHGWFHTVIGKRKKDGKTVLRLKRFRNWYSIPSKDDYLKVKQNLIKAGVSVGWDSTNHQSGSYDFVNDILSETSSLIAEKNKSVEQKKKLSEKVLELRSKISEYELAFQKLKPEAWKEDLEEFQKLLQDSASEHTIQEWIYLHLWIFGPYYIEATKQEISRDNDKIDFLMGRYDSFYDVIELKLSTCNIFENVEDQIHSPSRENPMSSDVKNAISQVIKYLEEYELDKGNRLFASGQLIHKPKAIIIIGRGNIKTKNALRTLNDYLHRIEVLTYDDILDRGKELIKMFETARKPKLKKI